MEEFMIEMTFSVEDMSNEESGATICGVQACN